MLNERSFIVKNEHKAAPTSITSLVAFACFQRAIESKKMSGGQFNCSPFVVHLSSGNVNEYSLVSIPTIWGDKSAFRSTRLKVVKAA